MYNVFLGSNGNKKTQCIPDLQPSLKTSNWNIMAYQGLRKSSTLMFIALHNYYIKGPHHDYVRLVGEYCNCNVLQCNYNSY